MTGSHGTACASCHRHILRENRDSQESPLAIEKVLRSALLLTRGHKACLSLRYRTSSRAPLNRDPDFLVFDFVRLRFQRFPHRVHLPQPCFLLALFQQTTNSDHCHVFELPVPLRRLFNQLDSARPHPASLQILRNSSRTLLCRQPVRFTLTVRIPCFHLRCFGNHSSFWRHICAGGQWPLPESHSATSGSAHLPTLYDPPSPPPSPLPLPSSHSLTHSHHHRDLDRPNRLAKRKETKQGEGERMEGKEGRKEGRK